MQPVEEFEARLRAPGAAGAVIGAAGSLLSDASSLSFKWGGGGSSGSNSYSDYNQTGLPGNGVA